MKPHPPLAPIGLRASFVSCGRWLSLRELHRSTYAWLALTLALLLLFAIPGRSGPTVWELHETHYGWPFVVLTCQIEAWNGDRAEVDSDVEEFSLGLLWYQEQQRLERLATWECVFWGRISGREHVKVPATDSNANVCRGSESPDSKMPASQPPRARCFGGGLRIRLDRRACSVGCIKVILTHLRVRCILKPLR
jgi:hypothetical protein